MKSVKVSKNSVTTKYEAEDIELFKNELFIYLLAKQKNISFIPKILSYDCDKLIICTKNVGISMQDYCDGYGCEFDDFIPRIRTIYNKLIKLGYYHNDLRLKNIVINPNNEKLYLIDFEFTDREYKDLDEEDIVKKITSVKNPRKSRSKRKAR